MKEIAYYEPLLLFASKSLPEHQVKAFIKEINFMLTNKPKKQGARIKHFKDFIMLEY